ncbi:hypothetical protein BO78DRAFT_225902 [Aspergillus sclerotiicarbonarius CBS 121057]|uniref:Uncharacterized protein n=1 Tax=Aspergillus sclerotiicarbonarius (strain CBS 121057 / IBT 28362) TaxID=1448318 RepID=A0A319DWZ0_ASPSB|nr:hypothetical protein BO78DRAFT_225902 [Aspergillus sclerotiicarbonarius CBS 121057]
MPSPSPTWIHDRSLHVAMAAAAAVTLCTKTLDTWARTTPALGPAPPRLETDGCIAYTVGGGAHERSVRLPGCWMAVGNRSDPTAMTTDGGVPWYGKRKTGLAQYAVPGGVGFSFP